MNRSWLLHDMIRICPRSGDVLEQESRHRHIGEFGGRDLRLVSPRNAYLSFQLIVNAEEGAIPDLQVEFDPLSGDAGDLEKGELAVYVQWYHRIGDRYMPDALVPWGAGETAEEPFAAVLRRNDVPGRRYAALWIDLFVDENAGVGCYQGNVRVRSGGAEENHRIFLEVVQASVPQESVLYADLNSYADGISKVMGIQDRQSRFVDGSYFAAERQYVRMAHEHRALFHFLGYRHDGRPVESFAPELEGAGKSIRVKDWTLFDEHFGGYLDGSAFAGSKRGPIPIPYMYLPFNFHWPADYAKFGLKGYRTEFSAIWREFHRHFTEKDWLRTKFELFLNHKKRFKLFPYDGEEPRFVWDEKINDLYADLTRPIMNGDRGAQFVFRTDSSWSYGLHYEKYGSIIKHWVVNEQMFSWFPESVDALRAHGNTIWNYGSAQKIGSSLLGTVVSPLTAIARGIDGFTYWDSLSCGETWPDTPCEEGSLALFYPGNRLFGIPGPIPSLRLKILRNVMQIADCLELWIRGNPASRRPEISASIEQLLGVQPGGWWPGKPEFLDKPPYEWVDAMLSVAPFALVDHSKPPERFIDFANDMWKKLEREENPS